MKKHFRISLLICAVAALFSGGCAKHDVVKTDQMVPPVKPSASVPAKPAVKVEAKAADKTPMAPMTDAAKLQPAVDADAALKAALEKVFFDFDSATLSAKARETLAKDAGVLQKADAKIRIEGHCDELGSDDYNLALGDRRAKAAMNYLQTIGISASRLSTISFGKEKPADPGHDDAARARNRFDELVISSK